MKVIVRPDTDFRDVEEWEPSCLQWPWVGEVLHVDKDNDRVLIHYWGFNDLNVEERGKYYRLFTDDSNDVEHYRLLLGCDDNVMVNSFCNSVALDAIVMADINFLKSNGWTKQLRVDTMKKWAHFMEQDLYVRVDNPFFPNLY